MLAPELLETIAHALREDIGTGDVTTDSIIPVDAMMSGQIIAKQSGVVAGLSIAETVFSLLDTRVQFTAQVADGTYVENRQVLAKISGPTRSLLTGERTALNFLGRMSGIATLTHQFVDQIAGTKARILDTRKTAPGLRRFDKLAVQMGGGKNHRMGLYDMVLIKDNHIDSAGSLVKAVKKVRAAQVSVPIEVETRTLSDVRKAVALQVQYILLDNMSVAMMCEAVKLKKGNKNIFFEASGNVSLKNVRKIAQTGVDFISIGALTHSASTFDISFLWTDSQ